MGHREGRDTLYEKSDRAVGEKKGKVSFLNPRRILKIEFQNSH